MKKKIVLALSLVCLLSGCQTGKESGTNASGSMASSGNVSSRPKGEEKIYSMETGYIGIASGDVRVVAPEGSTRVGVSPFSTSIQGRLYYYEDDFDKDDLRVIASDFNSLFCYYHALSDNHYDYRQVTERDDRGNAINRKQIINVKYLNDHPDTDIEVDPFLFDLIKTSYDFTINSSLLFNRFSESLSSLYEKKLSEDEYSGKALNKALSLATNVRFKDDFTEEEISNARKSVPSSLDEAKNSITFNPEKHTIRLNTIIRDGKRIVPRRNLGGSAKGFATKKVAEYFEQVYPGISLMINSGSSSILAVGSRPDDKPWKISYTNPVYKEQRMDGKKNPAERYLEFSGSFNRSTSGYYEHYFYCYNQETKEIHRRDHIFNTENGFSSPFFDQVSVIIDDTGIADRYTTAIRNTKSVQEAYGLFKKLNAIYSFDGDLMLCYKGKKKDEDSLYSYTRNSLSPLSDKGYPISVLNDGSEYKGDYSDLSASSISTVTTKNNFDFSEIYLRTDKRYQSAHLFTNVTPSYFPYPENSISVLKALK